MSVRKMSWLESRLFFKTRLVKSNDKQEVFYTMRTKRIIAFLMICCLTLSLAVCGNQASASQELGGIFPAVAGENGTTYRSLFAVILDDQYDAYWNEKCASIVGDEAAEASAEALKASISRDIYGQEAIDAYA